ncbi:MAG: putative DNA base hypermodification protein, partial [Gammaproteobacteria bacterium]|nr:putative DNA base hypermodification protein [Gammaproteobacteria bacterium]
LSQYQGWGGFMSYEVATDMRWTRYLCQASDICTYANPGPGAKRGLNRLSGRPIEFLPTIQQAIHEMNLVYQQVLKSWPSPSEDWPALEMREIEHSLCEFDKYQRVKNHQGKTRSKFPGFAEDQPNTLLWGEQLCT